MKIKNLLAVIVLVALSIEPIFYLYAHNYGFYPIEEYLKPTMFFITLTLFTYTAFLLFLKSHIRAILFSYIVIFAIWFFVVIDSLLDGNIEHASKIALVAILSLCSILSYIVWKHYDKVKHTVAFFSVFLLIFYANSFIKILQFEWDSINYSKEHLKKESTNNISTYDMKSIKNAVENKELPDIYWIVLDSYARKDILKNIYNYDNSQFIESLTSRNFTVNNLSFSNYMFTTISIPSMLNMQYFNIVNPHSSSNSMMLQKLYRDNAICSILRQIGYKIYMLQDPLWAPVLFKDAQAAFKDDSFFGLTEVELTLLKKTIAFPFYSRLAIGSTHATKLHVLNILKNQKSENVPKFFYAHLLLPHAPYLFNVDGTHTNQSEFSGLSPHELKGAYIGQLKFTNSKILEIVDSIIKNSKKPPVILIHSDHGAFSWNYADEKISPLGSPSYLNNVKINFSNFSALYMQGKTNLKLPKTNINLFPFIFNSIWGHTIEMQPDRMIANKPNSTRYDFYEVTTELEKNPYYQKLEQK